MEKKHGNPIAFLKWVAEFQDENGNYIELTGDRWHFSDKDDTDNVTEDQLWELYKLHYPDVEDQLATANETIKVLEYDNNRLKGEVEGLNSAVEELRTKYDNILATESGHESKTENVWQSGYAAGHEAASERGKWKAQPGEVWVKASERLPGVKTPVKWREGETEMKVKTVWYMVLDTNSEYLSKCEWLDESAAGIQIDREWVNNALVEFALAYNRSNNKDIANDAAEYLNDKLNEAGVIYVLVDDWVDVNDRLPYKDGDSSVYCLVNDTYDGIVVRPFNEVHVCWDQEDGDDYYTDAKGGKITHWKPLPEPPKRKQQKEK